MDTSKVKHQYFLSKWAPIIQECRTSGMTVKAWCQENDVDEGQFFIGNAGYEKNSAHLCKQPRRNRQPFLPHFMFNDATGFDRVYIACGYTDLRHGIDGLAGIVQNEFHLHS